MGAVVPIFNDPNYLDRPGAELAASHAFGDDGEQDHLLRGLVWSEARQKWYHPRAEALRTQQISVEDLDDEELIKGQLRDSDGKFRGGPMRQVPKEFHDELMRRIIGAGTEKLRGAFLESIDVILEIVRTDTNPPELRAKWAQYIIERLAGRTPDVVQHTVAVKPWEIALQGIVREYPGDVVDGEVVDDDD